VASVGGGAALDLATLPHVGGEGHERVEGDLGDVGVALGQWGIEAVRAVPDSGRGQPDPAVQPGAAPKPPSTGIETASTTAGPTTGPELVKFSRLAPAASSSLASLIIWFLIPAGTSSADHGVDRYATPWRSAVWGVMPNWANTGMPARAMAATASGKSAAPSSLTKSTPPSFDQPDRRAHRAVGSLLQGTEGEIAGDQRTADAAADRPADDEHLLHRHFERVGFWPHRLTPTVSPTETMSAPARSAMRAI
jgi:hypothetical protein